MLVGNFILAKSAQLPQADAATISKDTADPISHIPENQTKVEIEPVKVKPEGVPSALGNESSEINIDDEPIPVAEVSYHADPSYDPVGAELERIIAGDTSAYVQNASADLAQLDPNRYTVDPLEQLAQLNGDDRLLNQLDPTRRNNPTEQPQPVGNYQPATQAVNTVQYHYNGDGHLVGKTVDGVRTDFALDIAGDLPEVIYTSEGNSYLHLPGMIMTENATGDVRYLLMDGLGSVRQVVDEAGNVVASYEFDPYGNPVQTSGGDPYGYTGEWWENEVGLLHLRERWYSPETGTFLSRDSVEGEPPYLYAGGNPINKTDPDGRKPVVPGFQGCCRNPFFTNLPMAESDFATFNGFGPNNFAYEYGDQYYSRLDGLHNGLDFNTGSTGKTLYAMDQGIVWYANKDTSPFGSAGPGNIIIRHGDHVAVYGHINQVPSSLEEGVGVEAGDQIGVSGPDGVNPHLHLEVRKLPAALPSVAFPCVQPHQELKLLGNSFWQTRNYVNPLLFFSAGPRQQMLNKPPGHSGVVDWIDEQGNPTTIDIDTDDNGYPDRVDINGDGVADVLGPYTVRNLNASGANYWANSQIITDEDD